jgi:glucuronate isomerase
MTKTTQSADLLSHINKMPAIDIHTHLNAAHLGARGLHDILLYHMVISDLYSAGCPDGSRLSENPDEKEVTTRIEAALPYLPLIQNTSCFWLCKNILAELYNWHEPITAANWRKLDEQIKFKSSDLAWPRQILAKAGIRKAGTELALRGDGKFDDMLFYALEWAFFARTQWGVFDAPLFELEYAWNQDKVTSPLSVSLKERPVVQRHIKTVEDVKAAMSHYCRLIPKEQVRSTAQHLSTDIQYQMVSDSQMQKALNYRSSANQNERDIYASYLLEAFLCELEKESQPIMFQFSFGAEPLPYETASRLNQNSIAQLAEIVARHPLIKFQCFLSSRHANQSLCTLCRELPNLSLAGYWWHNFFPSIITQIIDERLDMLPVNKQVGFFSDAYCVEWLWAKSKLVRQLLSNALQNRIDRKQYTIEQAIEIAESLLQNTPGKLLKLRT